MGCQESWLQLDSSGLRACALIHLEERGRFRLRSMSVFSFYFYKNLNKLDYSSYLENSVVFFFKSALKDKKKKKSAAPVIRDSSWRWHVYTVLLWHLWLHQRGK